MENFENSVFGFSGDKDNKVSTPDNEFNIESISGLGESDYENEDLFTFDNVEHTDSINKNNNENFDGYLSNQVGDLYEKSIPASDTSTFSTDFNNDDSINNVVRSVTDEENNLNTDADLHDISSVSVSEPSLEATNEFSEPTSQPIIDPVKNLNNSSLEVNQEEITTNDDGEDSDSVGGSTSTLYNKTEDDLSNLTQFEEEKIEKTDINSLFDRVNVNVKEASDIFRKNTEMKEKIDARFDELKKLQSEIEKTKQSQIDEINEYKDEVYAKLTSKKEEIEQRLNTLKEVQASLEKEKNEFESYKKKERENIEAIKKEVQKDYDNRREELNDIEDKLRKQKDSLDAERNELTLEKIQYESDKNELANNLLKFNDLVDSFTNGMSGIKDGE